VQQLYALLDAVSEQPAGFAREGNEEARLTDDQAS